MSGAIVKKRSNVSLFNKTLYEMSRCKNDKSFMKKIESLDFSVMEWVSFLRKSILSNRFYFTNRILISKLATEKIDTSNWFDEFETLLISKEYLLAKFILENGLKISDFEKDKSDGYTLILAIKNRSYRCFYEYDYNLEKLLIQNGAKPTIEKKSLNEWKQLILLNPQFGKDMFFREKIFDLIKSEERNNLLFKDVQLHNDICPLSLPKN